MVQPIVRISHFALTVEPSQTRDRRGPRSSPGVLDRGQGRVEGGKIEGPGARRAEDQRLQGQQLPNPDPEPRRHRGRADHRSMTVGMDQIALRHPQPEHRDGLVEASDMLTCH